MELRYHLTKIKTETLQISNMLHTHVWLRGLAPWGNDYKTLNGSNTVKLYHITQKKHRWRVVHRHHLHIWHAEVGKKQTSSSSMVWSHPVSVSNKTRTPNAQPHLRQHTTTRHIDGHPPTHNLIVGTGTSGRTGQGQSRLHQTSKRTENCGYPDNRLTPEQYQRDNVRHIINNW